jgi:hypothetical protein
MRTILAIAAALLPLALAADAPEIKEGLWSIHTQTIDNPGNKKMENTSTLCRDHAYDKSVEAKAAAMKGCTKVSENIAPGKRTVEMRCVVGGTTIDTKSVVTFNTDSAAHSENHSTYSPAVAGISENTMIMDQTYKGDCPAGMQPGDRANANGQVIHSGGR